MASKYDAWSTIAATPAEGSASDPVTRGDIESLRQEIRALRQNPLRVKVDTGRWSSFRVLYLLLMLFLIRVIVFLMPGASEFTYWMTHWW